MGKTIKHHPLHAIPMKESIYSGKILGLSVHHTEIEGRKVIREIIEHRGAAAMLGFDEDGRAILVRQHRYPHGYVLEIPAGTLEEGEEPEACAHREMVEETGYRAEEMVPLLSYYPSIGYNMERIHCFLASGLRKVAEVDPDNDEFISVVKMEMKELIAMIKRGEIEDSKTICAVMVYAARNGLA
jgi:ADP-ribose pyrophosphatase